MGSKLREVLALGWTCARSAVPPVSFEISESEFARHIIVPINEELVRVSGIILAVAAALEVLLRVLIIRRVQKAAETSPNALLAC